LNSQGKSIGSAYDVRPRPGCRRSGSRTSSAHAGDVHPYERRTRRSLRVSTRMCALIDLWGESLASALRPASSVATCTRLMRQRPRRGQTVRSRAGRR
jgi:hypothetical protein